MEEVYELQTRQTTLNSTTTSSQTSTTTPGLTILSLPSPATQQIVREWLKIFKFSTVISQLIGIEVYTTSTENTLVTCTIQTAMHTYIPI